MVVDTAGGGRRAESAATAHGPGDGSIADAHRPQYHFLPPANWMNDPNGLIQWRGRYHLFYQYDPTGPIPQRIHWGHAVSADLVDWTHLPVALAPTPGSPDEDGCWSGCAVDHDGVPTLIYSGHRGGTESTCVARSRDDLLTWEKEAANPVTPGPPADLDLAGCRDPAVWRQGDEWYQLLGAGVRGVGGAALLYRSRDLIGWDYLQPILVGDRAPPEPVRLGRMWECPDLFPLDDRHVLIVSPKDERRLYRPASFVGAYAAHRFEPERVDLLDQGDSFYAPRTMSDDRGRRLMWGWLREARDATAQRAAGWSGVMSLPRLLGLRPDGSLGSEPAGELTALRGAHVRRQDVDLGRGAGNERVEVRGRSLEIVAVWEPGDALAFGLDVACSPDGDEATRIRYEPGASRLVVDRRRSSASGDVARDERGGTVALAAGEPLTLRIFVDHSVVEVFANGRACHATRIYPTRVDSDGVGLFAEGGSARLTRLDVWELGSIWDRGPGG